MLRAGENGSTPRGGESKLCEAAIKVVTQAESSEG